MSTFAKCFQSFVSRMLRHLLSSSAVVITVSMLPCCPTFANPNNPPTRILVMGDSLAAEYGLARDSGWVKLLEQELNKEAKTADKRVLIINASISGETSSGGMNRLGDELSQKKPDLVIIELGANDGLRGLALLATRDNLRKMIKDSQATGAQVLLLGMQIPPNYGRDYALKFKQMFQDLKKETICELVDFFLADIAANREMFQADGLHPTEAAQPILMQSVKTALTPMLTSAHRARPKGL